MEFITLISTQANEISEKEAKKTIAVEHIEKALVELEFADYVPEVVAVADEFKEQQKVGLTLESAVLSIRLTSEPYRRVRRESTRWRLAG